MCDERDQLIHLRRRRHLRLNPLDGLRSIQLGMGEQAEGGTHHGRARHLAEGADVR